VLFNFPEIFAPEFNFPIQLSIQTLRIHLSIYHDGYGCTYRHIYIHWDMSCPSRDHPRATDPSTNPSTRIQPFYCQYKWKRYHNQPHPAFGPISDATGHQNQWLENTFNKRSYFELGRTRCVSCEILSLLDLRLYINN
jgi:hypothetical protein